MLNLIKSYFSLLILSAYSENTGSQTKRFDVRNVPIESFLLVLCQKQFPDAESTSRKPPRIHKDKSMFQDFKKFKTTTQTYSSLNFNLKERYCFFDNLMNSLVVYNQLLLTNCYNFVTIKLWIQNIRTLMFVYIVSQLTFKTTKWSKTTKGSVNLL